MLSPDHLVPTKPAQGVILHIRVDDVREALERSRQAGATVALEPTRTHWGWGSAMVVGPEGVFVDFYRPITEKA